MVYVYYGYHDLLMNNVAATSNENESCVTYNVI